MPVSTNDDIEVELAELSNASVDEENGTCTWIFDLSPNEQKELDLKYQVNTLGGERLVLSNIVSRK